MMTLERYSLVSLLIMNAIRSVAASGVLPTPALIHRIVFQAGARFEITAKEINEAYNTPLAKYLK